MKGIPARAVSFDRLARPYRWLEYLSFGRALERCRFALLPELANSRRVLLYGDGDGRFLERLLAVYAVPEVDAVDSSRAMLRIAEARLSPEARRRVRFHHADALRFTPPARSGEGYDLVVTHFFLDCFREEELHHLLGHIEPHLAADARWLISEFAVPRRRLPGLAARALIRLLYMGFGLLTGLRMRHLPEYGTVLAARGFLLSRRRVLLGDLLHSELWLRTSPQPPR